MSNIGKVAYLMVAAGFPIYLLWKGELGAYLALATSTSAPAQTSNAPLPATVAPGIGGLTPYAPGF